MKRSWIKRSNKPIKRRKAMPRGPTPEGKAFNEWVKRIVKARDKVCVKCRGADLLDAFGHVFGGGVLDCAHMFRLGAGASRYNPRDWRNYPSARRVLCRTDHVALDERREWTWEELGYDLKRCEDEAREEMRRYLG